MVAFYQSATERHKCSKTCHYSSNGKIVSKGLETLVQRKTDICECLSWPGFKVFFECTVRQVLWEPGIITRSVNAMRNELFNWRRAMCR